MIHKGSEEALPQPNEKTGVGSTVESFVILICEFGARHSLKTVPTVHERIGLGDFAGGLSGVPFAFIERISQSGSELGGGVPIPASSHIIFPYDGFTASSNTPE